MSENVPIEGNSKSHWDLLYSRGLISEAEASQFNEFEKRMAKVKQQSILIDEVVKDVLVNLSIEDKNVLKNTPESDLIKFHHGLGTYIRNSLREKGGKIEGPMDDLEHRSLNIIRRIWEALQDGAN